MSKETNVNGPVAPEKYEEVVQRLDDVVKRLEGGQLSLEDSLKAFEEGVRLVQKGEKLLGDAEKRIEQLLSEEGEQKIEPLAGNRQGASEKLVTPPRRPAGPEEEDVPF